jgi:glycogen(starch) synthase
VDVSSGRGYKVLRVAFISSEFSGLPGSGGIGSYFLHCARCLAAVGCEVEVFTKGDPGQLQSSEGIRFHQLGTGESPYFAVRAAEAFESRHRAAPFDILEGAELHAEAALAARRVPSVALAVRLHSPSVLLHRYLDRPLTLAQRLRWIAGQASVIIGAYRRRLPVPALRFDSQVPPWFPDSDAAERGLAASADVVLVMSEEMRQFAIHRWWIAADRIVDVPNPLFESAQRPSEEREGRQPTIGFVGRLEPRKGILQLASALKLVLRRFPQWRAVLVGAETRSCMSGSSVGQIAREQLAEFGARVSFPGPCPPEEVAKAIDSFDICVFPSLWDNFPYAVLEAMAAGKAIVASRVGAVATMLQEGEAGVIVCPGSSRELAVALSNLMKGAELRDRLGAAAAARAASCYNRGRVTAEILSAYKVATDRRDERMATIVAGAVPGMRFAPSEATR